MFYEKKIWNILVIDDDTITLELIKKQLDGDYQNLTLTSNPLEAIELINISKFDLIIIDITNFQIRGIDLLKYIKSVNPWKPVILLAAQDNEEILKLAEKNGCNNYLKKPFKKEQMKEAIENVNIIY